MHYVLYSDACSTSLFGANWTTQLDFLKKIYTYFNAFFLSVFKFNPVYITEATLNANSNFDLMIIWCSRWFCNHHPYFEAVYCLICGRREGWLLLDIRWFVLFFARFLRTFTCGCMIEYRICMHKISEAYRFLAHRKPFITEPSYVYEFGSLLHSCHVRNFLCQSLL